MRELELPDVEKVAGGVGFDDTTLTMPTVTVTAPRQGRSYSGMMSAYDSMGIDNYLHQIQGANDGLGAGGGGGAYDPSPEDGIYGIAAEEQPDGSIAVTVETNGFFDLNGDGIMADYEGPISPHSGVWEPSASQSSDDLWEVLETFLPLPSVGMV